MEGGSTQHTALSSPCPGCRSIFSAASFPFLSACGLTLQSACPSCWRFNLCTYIEHRRIPFSSLPIPSYGGPAHPRCGLSRSLRCPVNTDVWFVFNPQVRPRETSTVFAKLKSNGFCYSACFPPDTRGQLICYMPSQPVFPPVTL